MEFRASCRAEGAQSTGRSASIGLMPWQSRAGKLIPNVQILSLSWSRNEAATVAMECSCEWKGGGSEKPLVIIIYDELQSGTDDDDDDNDDDNDSVDDRTQ